MKKQLIALITITALCLIFSSCVFAQKYSVDLKVNERSKEVLYDIELVSLDISQNEIVIFYSTGIKRRFVIVNTNMSPDEMQFVCSSNGGTFEFTFKKITPTRCYIFCASNFDNYQLYTKN